MGDYEGRELRTRIKWLSGLSLVVVSSAIASQRAKAVVTSYVALGVS